MAEFSTVCLKDHHCTSGNIQLQNWFLQSRVCSMYTNFLTACCPTIDHAILQKVEKHPSLATAAPELVPAVSSVQHVHQLSHHLLPNNCSCNPTKGFKHTYLTLSADLVLAVLSLQHFIFFLRCQPVWLLAFANLG